MNRLNQRTYIIITQGAILVSLAVIIGAFGAHGLKPHLTAYQLDIFETGNRYHFYHGLGVLALAPLANYLSANKLKITVTLLILGVLLFSGSLYLLATRELLGITNWKFLGPLTPIGGVFFIIGWSYLGWTTLHAKKNHEQS